ncbi:hypothetical protein FRC10_006723 [Ceratobasidium sp. 414]|nr:hypothetical protein FRC10_006723 [Ceratobasidium sp. 414]
MMTAISRVLTTPELLSFICQFAKRSDDLNLLRVSRPFFDAAAPFVWENLRGVKNILTLISGIKFVSSEQEPKVQKISISGEKLDFKRFRKYAPLVRHLEIYGKDTEQYVIPSWWRLMKHARDKTLLPNLVALTLKTSSPSSSEIMMWIRAFLSPTLVKIAVIPFSPNQHTLISYLEASTLLRYIDTTCPSLKHLSLFPNREDAASYKTSQYDGHTVMHFWDSSLPRQLARLQSLRELHTTTEVLMPHALSHLAGLPHLETLAIYPTTHPFTPKKRTLDNPFPALQRFILNWAHHTLFAEVWQLRVFEHVTSLALTFVTHPKTPNEEVLWTSSLMALIRDNSPNLTSLSIDFHFACGCGNTTDISPRSVILPMKELPLHELELVSARLKPLNTTDAWSLVPTVWSQLTVLKLPDELVAARELMWFSELLNLEHLTVNLSLSTPLPELASVPSDETNMRFSTLQSSQAADITGDIHVIARWLLSLWPTLKSVKWQSETFSGRQHRTERSQSAFEALASGLNSTIDLLRELNETKSRLSREMYGGQALGLFSRGL